MEDHRLVVVGGLHRSGTTPLARTLATHPQVSGFSGTGAREDEGQHLQTVYPRVRDYGGAGHFAFTGLTGGDYVANAKQVEEAVRAL